MDPALFFGLRQLSDDLGGVCGTLGGGPHRQARTEDSRFGALAIGDKHQNGTRYAGRMPTENALELLELMSDPDPRSPPVASVIVLHGLGADGNDFVPVAQALDLSAIGPVRFVLPSAPVRPVTIDGGYAMRAWYDIYPPSDDPAIPRREDTVGLRASQLIVQQLIDREVQRGVAPGRIVVMGFSQGCAMALLAGLRAPQRLAGLVALSGYLPLAGVTAQERSAANQTMAIFMAHGSQDAVVAPERGEAARAILTAQGDAVQWHSYPMGHEVCAPEIRDLNAWLLQTLAPSVTGA